MGLLMYGGMIMRINERALHVYICICDILHLCIVLLFAFMVSIKEVSPFLHEQHCVANSILRSITN